MRRNTATTGDMPQTSASGWHTLRRMGPYLWPAGQAWAKRRVVWALLFLLVAKIVSVSTPWLYKEAVDRLTHPQKQVSKSLSGNLPLGGLPAQKRISHG